MVCTRTLREIQQYAAYRDAYVPQSRSSRTLRCDGVSLAEWISPWDDARIIRAHNWLFTVDCHSFMPFRSHVRDIDDSQEYVRPTGKAIFQPSVRELHPRSELRPQLPVRHGVKVRQGILEWVDRYQHTLTAYLTICAFQQVQQIRRHFESSCISSRDSLCHAIRFLRGHSGSLGLDYGKHSSQDRTTSIATYSAQIPSKAWLASHRQTQREHLLHSHTMPTMLRGRASFVVRLMNGDQPTNVGKYRALRVCESLRVLEGARPRLTNHGCLCSCLCT